MTRLTIAAVAAVSLVLAVSGAADVGPAVQIKNIAPGNTSSTPASFRSLGSGIGFVADDGTHGAELWTSDGSTGGTKLVQDIEPGPGGSSPGSLKTKYDSDPARVYFSAFESGTGREPWKTNGTDAGTGLIRDLVPGSAGSDPKLFTGQYFAATTPGTGYELWKTDGTAPGTLFVKDIALGPADSIVDFGWRLLYSLPVPAGILLFAADDGTSGLELWRSDGTAAGTYMVKDINPGGSSLQNQEPGQDIRGGYPGSPPIYFAADDGTTGTELWRTDGTSAGTVPVADMNPGGSSFPNDFTVGGDGVYFTADDGMHGRELWVSDGTPGGTHQVKDIVSGSGGSNPQGLFYVNDYPHLSKLYFSADDGMNGRELWMSDGSDPGTQMVKDINPTGSSNPTGLAYAFGRLVFAADDGTRGVEPWSSPGTYQGTAMVADLNPTGSSSPTEFTAPDRMFFFAATEPSTGRELWGLGSNPATAAFLTFVHARRAGAGAVVSWRTATEIGVLGFDVYRGGSTGRTRVNHVVIHARGGTQGHTYYVHDGHAPAVSRYWLRVTRLDGSRRWFGPTSIAGT